MQEILKKASQELLNRNIMTEKELRRLMADKGLTQQELIASYTLVYWTKREPGEFGSVSYLSFHSAIVPNENVDEFISKLQEDLQQM